MHMSENNIIENEETAAEPVEEPADRPEPPTDENGNPCPPPHGPHGHHGPRPDGERPVPPKDENGRPCPPPHHGPHGPRPEDAPEEVSEEAPAAAEETA